VAGLREAMAERLVAARAEQPFSSVVDLFERVRMSPPELITLASIGALNALGVKRRGALWQAAALGRSGMDLFAGIDHDAPSAETSSAEPPVADACGEGEARPGRDVERTRGRSPLSDMSLVERLAADFRGTGMTTGPHPMTLVRERLARRGVKRAVELAALPDGVRVQVAGSVIVRQRPGTAKGFFFLTLEDETGFSNGIVTPKVFAAHRSLLTTAPALLIGGTLQNQDGVVSVKADRFELLSATACVPSRDFH
jgi:error-prone DNA polymerase